MAFPWIKNSVFWFIFFFLRFFLMVQSQMGQHWFGYWLGAEIKYSYVIFISGPPTPLPANPPVMPTFPWWKNPARHRSPHVTSFWCVMVRRRTHRTRALDSQSWVSHLDFCGSDDMILYLTYKEAAYKAHFLLLMSTWGHDDVMTWKRLPHYWPFVRGIYWSSMGSPHKRPMMRSIRVFFVVSLNRLNSRQDAIKFRPHGAHVTS